MVKLCSSESEEQIIKKCSEKTKVKKKHHQQTRIIRSDCECVCATAKYCAAVVKVLTTTFAYVNEQTFGSQF